MPIEHRIDHRRRIVLTRVTGTLADEETFGYQREVWSRPDVAGYDELVDMSDWMAACATLPFLAFVVRGPHAAREAAACST